MTNHNITHGLDALNGSDSKTQNSRVSEGLDTAFDLLSNPRRRAVIDVLHDVNNIRKGDLVDEVAAREPDKDPVHEDWSSERHTVYVSLQQTHLPRLEKVGVIEWDRDIIRLGPHAETVYRFAQPLFGSDESEEEDEDVEKPGNEQGGFGSIGGRIKSALSAD